MKIDVFSGSFVLRTDFDEGEIFSWVIRQFILLVISCVKRDRARSISLFHLFHCSRSRTQDFQKVVSQTEISLCFMILYYVDMNRVEYEHSGTMLITDKAGKIFQRKKCTRISYKYC